MTCCNGTKGCIKDSEDHKTCNITFSIAESKSEGVKHDQGKPKLTLVNRETLNGISKAMEYGMVKYGKNNYKSGMDWTRVIDALLRHANAYAAKEELDSESGLNHMYHVGACVNMLLYFIENNIGKDDR